MSMSVRVEAVSTRINPELVGTRSGSFWLFHAFRTTRENILTNLPLTSLTFPQQIFTKIINNRPFSKTRTDFLHRLLIFNFVVVINKLILVLYKWKSILDYYPVRFPPNTKVVSVYLIHFRLPFIQSPLPLPNARWKPAFLFRVYV